MKQYKSNIHRNCRAILLFLICLISMDNVWSKPSTHYTNEISGGFHIKKWELKPKYDHVSKKVLNNIQLFSNLSSRDSFFGEAGDQPWSWKYAACEANPLVTSPGDKTHILTKKDFYLPTRSLNSLYQSLRNFSKVQCQQTQIIADFRENKMQRLFNISPPICRAKFIKQFKTDKDLVSAHDMEKMYFGSTETLQNIGGLFIENTNRLKWLLDCTTNELYPSNDILERSMSEYITFFSQIVLQSTYDEQCTLNMKSINKDFLKTISTKCMKSDEP